MNRGTKLFINISNEASGEVELEKEESELCLRPRESLLRMILIPRVISTATTVLTDFSQTTSDLLFTPMCERWLAYA